MPDPVTGIIGGSALIGGASTVYAANKASDATESGTQQALNTEWEMFQQQREDFAPWREAGQRALGTLEEKIQAGPGEFNPLSEPGYQFGYKEFVERPYLQSQGARGKRLSGETAKGLTRYAQDYANMAYDNFLNRYYQSLTPYQSLAGVGQTAAAGQASAAGAYGQNAANLQYNNALAQGNYQTQMAAGIAGTGQNALNQYMNYNIMNKVLGQSAGGGWGFDPTGSGTAYPIEYNGLNLLG